MLTRKLVPSIVQVHVYQTIILHKMIWIFSSSHLYFNVSDLSCGSNNGSSNKGWEDMCWKIGASITTLDKLQKTCNNIVHV